MAELALYPRIKIACPKCRAALSAPITHAGKMARCPVCGYANVVPRHRPNHDDEATESDDLAWRLPLPPRVAHESYLAVLDEVAEQRRKSIDAKPKVEPRRPSLGRLGWMMVGVNVITLIAIVMAIVAPLPVHPAPVEADTAKLTQPTPPGDYPHLEPALDEVGF